jgi:hypothetical protein
MLFQWVISLGTACDTAYQVRRIFGNPESYPFDWLVTPFDGLVELFRNRFEGFLSAEDLALGDDGTFIYDSRYKVRFHHDFENPGDFRPEICHVQEKYIRRRDRLHSILSGPGAVLFVRGQQFDFGADIVSDQDAVKLSTVISDSYPNLDFKLLVHNPFTAGVPESLGDRVAILQTKPRDPYIWQGDDAEWDRVFARALGHWNSA